MEQNSTRIIFDTNPVWKDGDSNFDDIFSTNLTDLLKFIGDNELNLVEVLLPEVVIQERLTQYSFVAEALFEKAASSTSKLSQLGLKFTVPKKKPNLRQKLESVTREKIKNRDITVLKVPQIDQKKLLDRAYKRAKPFSKEDKGFKDTLIWLSVLDHVKKHPSDDYIICTINTEDFDIDKLDKEFRAISSGTLYIFPETTPIKEHLDSKYVLQLELKEKFSKVEQEVYKHVGEVMTEINRYISRQKRRESDSPLTSSFHSEMQLVGDSRSSELFLGSRNSRWRDVVGADFIAMKVSNISEGTNNDFNVELEVEVHPRKFTDSLDDTRVNSHGWGIVNWRDTQSVLIPNTVMNVRTTYNSDTDTFFVRDVGSGLSLTHWHY